MRKTFYSMYAKRLIDFNLALISLIVLTPLLILVILLQIIFNGFPIFFTQERVGRDEKIFKLIKFRTMNNKKDKLGILLPDNQRKTLFGSFLRVTSIDELPSLINIIKGDMAVIGPRPLLVEYLPLYNQEQKKRHLVRPGLSGLAQVKGRNNLSWHEKLNFDLIYINRISFFYDLKIIIITILVVILQKGVNSNSLTKADNINGKY